ncbi:MAG: cytochrome P450 [Deltaproteobacteria bacterium]|nr:cytochrome P450 [Deltaproteobacteria bacterium]
MEIARVLAVDEIDLSHSSFWLRPLEEREGAFATLRAERPVPFTAERPTPGLNLPVGPGYWSLTRHADILEASRNPELFSSAGGATSIQTLPAQFNEFFGGMINMDDPRHGAQRRIVSRGFTPRALSRLEAGVRSRADAMIDRVIEKGECDFVAELAAPLPLEIICDLMGIPESQTEMVFRNTNRILGLGDPDLVAEDQDLIAAAMRAGAELAALMKEMAEDRRERPREDLTSVLLDAGLEGGALASEDLTSFFILLVVAGNETTRNAISHGMKALCDHPDERRRWAADFEGLAATAVEEIVRWASPVIFMRRNLRRDTSMFGPAMKAGDKVVLWYASGNRDEQVFREPHRFDVGRSPNPHVGFGGPGPHFCLGANLARREIRIVFERIFARLPDLEITGPPARLESNFIHGIKRMPCAWTPGRKLGR